ncbi:hypothetical protein BGZ76_002046 [Entomortierella beljakovae]|nr:hypothetical protein BGZ76_002046 [Entomortierella beljakovae]
MNQTHIFGGHQFPANLHRETTEDISKMYTTLYDSEDPMQQQEYFHHQNQQYRHTVNFESAYSAPASPASDCYSASSSGSPLESPYSSPLPSHIKSMNFEETDELATLFNITIDDLLSADPIAFQYPKDFTAEDVDLFATELDQHERNHFQQAHHHHHRSHNEMAISGASPTLSFSSLQSPCLSPYHDYDTDMETSPSPTTQPQAAFPVSGTQIESSIFPNTNGMTVMRGEDGAIMVYNPRDESMTFRCEICPKESFGRIHDLKRHHQSKHQEKSWPCEYCHRKFARRDALLRHYTVKAERVDGVHPASHETDLLVAARARAKLI